MGIRYYAYPLHAADVPLAECDPRQFMSADPLADAWGLDPGRPKPRMLYLDKAWRPLQLLFAEAATGEDPPISAQLVAGRVWQSGQGWWEPHIGVLPPEQVAAIARDIVRFGPVDQATAERIDRLGPSADYVNDYLLRAQEFTAEIAGDGLGLVYMIG